jgi:hypothetical protein
MSEASPVKEAVPAVTTETIEQPVVADVAS